MHRNTPRVRVRQYRLRPWYRTDVNARTHRFIVEGLALGALAVVLLVVILATVALLR